MSKYLIIVITALIAIISIQYRKNKSLEDDISTLASNEKALINLNDSFSNRNIELKLSIRKVNSYGDSILVELNKTRKELKIKDKDLKYMQYLASTYSATDTVNIVDTVFTDVGLNIDKTIENKWRKLRVVLKYPSTVIVDSKFTSEKKVFFYYKKETVNPPRKCWIGRLFQKKHKIVEVEVVEENPYIINKVNRFINVVE